MTREQLEGAAAQCAAEASAYADMARYYRRCERAAALVRDMLADDGAAESVVGAVERTHSLRRDDAEAMLCDMRRRRDDALALQRVSYLLDRLPELVRLNAEFASAEEVPA